MAQPPAGKNYAKRWHRSLKNDRKPMIAFPDGPISPCIRACSPLGDNWKPKLGKPETLVVQAPNELARYIHPNGGGWKRCL